MFLIKKRVYLILRKTAQIDVSIFSHKTYGNNSEKYEKEKMSKFFC